MKPEVLDQKPISVAHAKAHIEAVEAHNEELSFRSGKTKDYLNIVAQVNKDQAEEIIVKLQDLNIPRLKIEHIIKIIDILPTSDDDLKHIISGYNLALKADQLKQIVDILDEYRPVK